MWWIYFNTGAERASDSITHSSDPGRLARLAYTYIHIVIIAGIVICAVSDELSLAHPTGHAEMATRLVMLGGPAIYIAGNLLFKKAMTGRAPLSHLAGLAVLVLLFPVSVMLSPLAISAGATVALLIVATWETVSLRTFEVFDRG